MEFELIRLKKRPSYPFETIAIGLSFSRRMDYLLAEGKKIADACGAKLLLIHVGEKTKGKEKQLDDVLFKYNIQQKAVKIIWAEGEIVDSVLKLCKLNIVDLLILGALEKESILKFYLGSVARSISRKAKCSILLLTSEILLQKTKQKIFVNVNADHLKTIHSVNTALYFSKRLGVQELTMIHEVYSPGLAMTMAQDSSAPEVTKIKNEFSETESAKLHTLLSKCETGNMKIEEKVIKGKPGYSVRKYAETKRADMLVINSPDMNLRFFDRVFTHDIEYILADIPCNLLIVHSRV